MSHHPESLNKKDFFLGFFAGMAITAIVALLVVVFTSFPMGSKSVVSDPSVVTAPTVKTPDSPDTAVDAPLEPTAPLLKVEVVEGDHVRGNADAPITIVEYSDFECPFCARFHATMEQIFAEYPDKVRWVYRHFPLDGIHPNARIAAEASECMAEQGKFWEFTDMLYANQALISESYLATAAKELGAKMSDFESCLDSGRHQTTVEKEFQNGLGVGVQGTPGTFFNGQPMNGAVPYETLKMLVEQNS